MKNYKQIEDLILRTKPQTEIPATLDERVLSDSAAVMAACKGKVAETGQLNQRKILMRNSIRFAAAAVILIGLGLSLTVFNKTVATAYGLEQTIKALKSMRSIHMKMFYPGYEEPVLIWATFDSNGQLDSLRVSESKLAPGDPHDGPKEAVLKDNKAQVWLKDKNIVFWLYSPNDIAKLNSFFQGVDPKLLVQKLEDMQREGTAQIKIERPEGIEQPIAVTASLPQEDALFGREVIALVDQTTKLVTSLKTVKEDRTQNKNGHLGTNDFSVIEFSDYNQTFDKEIFTLNIPADAAVVDQIERVIGLYQGKMSKEEIAVEVVKQFWDRVIERDYEAAGLLYQGFPANLIEQHFGYEVENEVMRVISISKAQVHPNPNYANNAYVVSSILEYETGEQTGQMNFNFVVKEVAGQPGQWSITGMIGQN